VHASGVARGGVGLAMRVGVAVGVGLVRPQVGVEAWPAAADDPVSLLDSIAEPLPLVVKLLELANKVEPTDGDVAIVQ